ncbi:hypothetical protein Hanom_Chr07g00647881 [Helianthus anomalus]
MRRGDLFSNLPRGPDMKIFLSRLDLLNRILDGPRESHLAFSHYSFSNQRVASSFLPLQFQQPAKGEQGPLNDSHKMMAALTGYPYQPYLPVDPNKRYQR